LLDRTSNHLFRVDNESKGNSLNVSYVNESILKKMNKFDKSIVGTLNNINKSVDCVRYGVGEKKNVEDMKKNIKDEIDLREDKEEIGNIADNEIEYYNYNNGGNNVDIDGDINIAYNDNNDVNNNLVELDLSEYEGHQ